MGYLRLILALLVLLSHAGWRVAGLNPGVAAVIGFYLISGYVMAALVRAHYNVPQRIQWFYADRLLRLAPQYLLYAALGALLWVWLRAQAAPGAPSFTPFLKNDPSSMDWFNNLLVVPLNYYMVNGSDQFALVPPAWSLGAELQFYLLAPVMLLWPRVGVVLALTTLGVHAMALMHWIHTDWFGYRLIPGVLWVFALGMLLFAWQRSRPLWAHALALAAPLLALGVYLLLRRHGLHAAPFHQEVLLGWGLGVPLVHWLGLVGMQSRMPKDETRNSARLHRRANALSGDASYGVFLNHFLLIWCAQAAGWQPDVSQPGNAGHVGLVLLACASVPLAVASQRYVETPMLILRRRIRAVHLT